MSSKFMNSLSMRGKTLLFLCVSFFVMLSNCANAVLINFDELDPNDYSYEGGNPYLTNEYESQGLVFTGSAYLLGWHEGIPSVSLPNYVIGPGFSLGFVGNLPTAVSFFFGSSSHSAVFIDAYGPNYENHLMSSGDNHGMTDEYIPYIPNELFSFSSSTGISSIEFSGWGDNYIDDLTYTYADQVTVPEPSAFILFAIGIFWLTISRLRFVNDLFNKRLSGRLL